MSKKVSIVFAGGGTGGHLYPAIAIANELQEMSSDYNIIFIGSFDKIESRVVPLYGYKFIPLHVAPMPRSISFKALAFPFTFIKSLIKSKKILLTLCPVCAVGTGGYVSVPVLLAANRTCFTIIHEQNEYPGLGTKMLSKIASKTFVSYRSTLQYLGGKRNVEFSGNPTRKNIYAIDKQAAIEHYNMSSGKKTVFIFGGSLGSKSINNAIKADVNMLLMKNIQIVWQTGSDMYDEIQKEFGSSESVRIYAFIENIQYAYSAADVVVSRAGAGAITELAKLGKACILVPYPYAAGNHQYRNAKMLENDKACLMLQDNEIKSKLVESILLIMETPLLKESLEERMKNHYVKDASKIICREIREAIKRRQNDLPG